MKILGIVRELNYKYHDLPEEKDDAALWRLYYDHAQDSSYGAFAKVSE